MNIGLLNERATFQTTSIEVDKYGNHKNTWADAFTCWATIATGTTRSSDEEETEGGVLEQPTMTLTLRYSPDTAAIHSNTHRVIFHDEIYNILSVDRVNYRKKMVKVQCKKVER